MNCEFRFFFLQPIQLSYFRTLPEKTGQDNNQGSKKGQTDSKKKDQGSRKARGNSKKKNHSSKKVVRKTSKKKKNAASPNAQLIPVAKSPGNDKSPAGFGRKKAGENLNEVMKHLRAPTPRAQQELEKTNWKTTTTETEDEDVAGQKYIKFMDQVAFIGKKFDKLIYSKELCKLGFCSRIIDENI